MPSKSLLHTLTAALATTCFIAPAAAEDSSIVAGPDVIIGAIQDSARYNPVTVNGQTIMPYSFGHTLCNLGTSNMSNRPSPDSSHPVTAVNAYRIKNGVIQQIGMRWVFHHFCSLQETLCSACTPAGSGCPSALGPGCSDPDHAGLTGDQGELGWRREINPLLGTNSGIYNVGAPGSGSSIGRRVQIRGTDLDPALNNDATYFAEAIVVAADDATAGNSANNASHRQFMVGTLTSGSYNLTMAGGTFQMQPALYAWQAAHPDVDITTGSFPNEGRLLVASRAIASAPASWSYEYAIMNATSAIGVGTFHIDIASCITTSNYRFHAPLYHSGDPHSNSPWTAERVNIAPGIDRIVFRTQAPVENPEGNRISWGTVYNFGFDANVPPADSAEVQLTAWDSSRSAAFEAYGPDSITMDFDSDGICDILDNCPSVANPTQADCDADGTGDLCDGFVDCNRNGVPDGCDVASGTSSDLDANGVPDECQPDCNGNDIPDAVDIAQATEADCDSDSVPDSCVDGTVKASTGEIGPFSQSVPAVGMLRGLSTSTTPVTIRVEAIGDLGAPTEYATLQVEGQTVGNFLFQTTGRDCPGQPDVAIVTMPTATWNTLLLSSPIPGTLSVRVFGSTLVSSSECGAAASTRVSVRYGGPLYDCDGDGLSDLCEIAAGAVDCNGNRWLDTCEVAAGATTDVDGNGIPDVCQSDCNANRLPDSFEIATGASTDCDLNLVPDGCDLSAGAPDCNGNEVIDSCEIASGAAADCNGNSRPDACDIAAGAAGDCDGNGVPDSCEINSGQDCNGNGLVDACEVAGGLSPDCNRNGLPDSCDIASGQSNDVDSNGIPDECKTDCNNNAIPDAYEIATGSRPDCNGNAIPDECDIAAGTADVDGNGVPDACQPDCNDNDLPDGYEIFVGLAPDCDETGIPDGCEITTGTAADCNTNGVPDSCDIANGAPDCDVNGVPDACDIATGAPDCNGNGTPDACEIAAGTPDCNDNAIPDTCDLADGATDCNDNGIPDSCDIASGTSNDIDTNGVPDECKTDCNLNGLPDSYEILQGLVPDCNDNDAPDSCDLEAPDADCDANGELDECEIAKGASDKDADGRLDSCEYAVGDFDLDGEIGGADLAVLLGFWGQSNPPIGDLDGDGSIGGSDLATLLSAWGPLP